MRGGSLPSFLSSFSLLNACMEGRISSEDRSCVDNFFGGLVLILLEVLLEHSSEVRDFGIVGFLVFPSVSRKQDIRIDTRASSGDCEVEDRHVLEFALFQFSAVNRIDDLSRHLQAHSRSLAVFTTRPTNQIPSKFQLINMSISH